MAMAMAMATYKSISVCSSATPATTAANSSCMLSSSYMPPPSFSLSSAVCVKKSTNCFGKLSLPRNLSSSLIWRSLQSPSSLGHWQEQKQKQSSFTVMALAKGKAYKMKTNKAAAKRFRVTGSGKLIRRRAGKQHLLVNKTKKRKKRLSKMAYVDKADYRNVCKHLPYVKVNKKIAP